MTETKKQNMKSWVGTWLTPSLIIGAIITGAWIGGQLKADADTRMFKDSQQKEKTRSHIDSDYNEVKNYQLMQEVSTMKKDLDTTFVIFNIALQKAAAAKKADSTNSANAVISRNRRDSLREEDAKEIQQIKREQRITSNAVQLILTNQQKILDTIN